MFALRIKIFILLFVCISLPSQGISAGEGGGNRRLAVSTKEIFATMKPGTAYRKDIFVRNGSSEVIPVQAYVWDLWHKGGEEIYAPQGTYQSSAAQWITIQPQKLSLAPGKSGKFHLNIFVPAGATGGNYAVIFFDTTPPLELVSGKPLQIDGKMANEKRVKIGIPTYIEVAGTGRAELDIRRFNITIAGGSKSIKTEFVVKNIGDVHVTPSAGIKIYNSSKKLVWQYPPKDLEINKIILPQQEISINAEWEKILKPGRYTAILTVNCGSGHPKTMQRDFKI
ncbi:MAG: hypothetical protein A3F16_00290 [Deltaproteobacteria bacterium RIFCSPHIGHO2_12_FULL_43_9]|nr:MAG: hypothetical protein A3F16_00290 [Deltaproteobacteria bacterium RIFCSPHIGHO2_12_FULL_43_9]